jgi:hypothetical protein
MQPLEPAELPSLERDLEPEQAVTRLWDDEGSPLWAGIPVAVIRNSNGYQDDAAGGCG